MDRRRAAGALFALAACVAATAAAPTASNQTALDLYDGTTEGCYYNFQHYGEGDRIMTNEPCLNCTCHNRMLMCYLRVCPFTKPIGQDCTVEKRADQCCPIVTCPDVPVDLLTSTSTTSPAEYGATGVGKLDKYGCSLNGKYFPEGSKVPPMPNKPCEHCYCIRNMTTCVMQECTLHVDGCTPIYHKDVCCPVRYSCDHPEDEIPLLDDMTTTVRPTPGFLLTTTTLSPVTQMSQDCVHDDQIVPDGALIKTEKACEHCYCMKGDIVCVVQECGTPMENEGKNCTSQPPREGQCCPDTYICEGDEVTTELLSESTTQTLVTEELTTILPPRRVGVEGSGYRNEPDEPFTELPTLETETEGSGYEEVTEVAIDIIGTTTKKQEEGESSTEDSFAFGTSTARTPTLEEIETTEPDKGLNTVPSGVIDEEHSITEKATFPAETVTEQILVEDNKTDQGLNEDLIPETTPTPERTAGLEDVYITTEPIFKKEDETVTESGLVESEKPTTVSSHIAEQLTTLSEQATSETKSPLDDEYEIKTTVITSSEVTEKAPEEAIDKKTTTESIKEAFTTPVSSKPLEEVTINEVEPSKTDAPAVITERIDTIETTSVDNKENEVEEDIPRIPGEGDCLLNEVTYRNNSNVPSTNNCHSSCKCVSSIIKCDPIICSPPPEYMDNCQPTYDSPESCCPTYVCHADETMPPQPHSQMSGTESPAIVPSIECNGDQCEVSKDKTDIDSPEKPIISECGLADCSDLAQKPVHPPKPYSEDCVGIDCQATPQNTCEGDSCGVIEPEIKPVHVVPLCDNENDCKVAHPPQPPCEGDACTPKGDCNTDDCRTGITTIPDSESQKPLTCNGNSDCQTPQSDSVTCEGDLCRKIEKTETESKLPSEDCKDSDCKEGKPDLEIGTEKPSKTKQPDEEDKQLSSTEEVHEVETVTKSEEPVDATESAVEKQTEIPELQTTSRMPLTEQDSTEKETPEYITSKPESIDTESPKASQPPTTPKSLVEKVTETTQYTLSTEKIKKDSSITDRQEEADAYTTHSTDVLKESPSTFADEVVTKAPLVTITDVFVSENTDLPATLFEEKVTKLPEEVEVHSKLTESPVTEYQELTTKSIHEVNHETDTTNVITDHDITDSLYTTESHDTVTMIPKQETIKEIQKQEIPTESPEQQTTTHKETSAQIDIVEQTMGEETTPQNETPELGSTEQNIITGTEPGPDAITESHEIYTVLPDIGVKEEVTTKSSEISPEKTDTTGHKETEITTISSEAQPTETSEGSQTVDLDKELTTDEEKLQSTTEAQKLFMDQEKSTTFKTEPQEAFTNAPTKEITEDKTSETESQISESSPETSHMPEHITTESTTEMLEDVLSSLATTPHEPSLELSTEKREEIEPIGSDNAGQVTTPTPELHISTEHYIDLDTIVPPIVKESEVNVDKTPETATVNDIDQQTDTPISHVTKILDTDSRITTVEGEDYASQPPQEEHGQTTEMPESQEPAKTPVNEITEQKPETDIIQSSVPTETEKSVTETVLLLTESAETATVQQPTHLLEDVTEVPIQDKTQEISTETLDKGTEAPSITSQDESITEMIPSEPFIPIQKESVTTDLPLSDKITTEAAQTIADTVLDMGSGASITPERPGENEQTQTDLPEHTDVDTKPEDDLPQEITTLIPEIMDTKIHVTSSEQSITESPVTEKEVIPSKHDETQGTTENSEDITTKDVFATMIPEISYTETPKETESPEVVYLQEHLTEHYPESPEETTAIPDIKKKEKETTDHVKTPEEQYTEHPIVVEEQMTALPEQAAPETHDTTKLPDVAGQQEITTESEEPVITENIQHTGTEAPESHVKEPEYDVSKTPFIPTGLQETETSTPQEKYEQAPEDMVTETPQELQTEKTDELTSEPQEQGHEKDPLDIFTPTEKIDEEVTTPISQQFTTKQIPEISPEISPDVTDKYEEPTTQTQQDIITKEPIVKTTEIPLLPDKMQTVPQLEIDSNIKHITTEPSQETTEGQEGLISVNVDQVTEAPEQGITEDLQVGVIEEQHVIPVKDSGETDVKLDAETTTETIDLVTHKDLQDKTTSEDYEKETPSDAITVPQQLFTEEPQVTTPESVQKIDIESPQDDILKETPSPQETATKEPEGYDITSMTEDEAITKSPMLPDDESSKLPTEQTSAPKYEFPETTPYVVELEEHTHKVVEEISTIVPFDQEVTTKLSVKDEDKEAAEITTRRDELTEEQPTTHADALSTQDETKVTLSDKYPEQPTVSLPSEELPLMTTPATPEGERVGDDISPPSTAKDEIPTQPETLEPQQTPEVEIPVQTEKASTTEKSLETDTSPDTVSHEEETTSATSKATTTIVKDEISTQSPAPQDTYSKPEEKPSEILPSTATPEVPKPGLNDVQPTDDIIPDDENQFPPSGGTSGYGGPEPDYVEEDQAFGPGTCRYGGKVYVSAQQIPRDDPCDFCFCFRSDIICLQQSCPPPIHGCHEEPIQGFCCPRYECPVAMATTLNITTTTTTTTTTLPPHFFAHHYKGDAQRTGCQIKGHTYKVGEVVRASSGPCLHCTCGGDGQMKCDPKACTPEPMLRQMIAAAVSAKRRR